MKKTTQQFILEVKNVHGENYDYSKIEYINNKTKVCLICPKHGEFWAYPNNILHGQKCPKCQGKYKTLEELIKEFRKIHGDKYDYSKFVYTKAINKSIIICPIHGEFLQNANKHLSGCGCPKCCKNYPLTTQEFISKVENKFPERFSFEKTDYINAKTKVCITCKLHGDFYITPDDLMSAKYGCPICGGRKVFNNETFIKEGNLVHHNKYDYSKVEYINAVTKVCIICPKHGEFWQTPNDHINNRRGCALCHESKLEEEIRFFLTQNNIKFIYECNKTTLKWLNNQSLDFFLPDYNLGIECHGEQHFKCVDFFGGMEEYAKRLFNDQTKYNNAKINNVEIIYYTNVLKTPKNYFNIIYKNIDLLKNKILSTPKIT